MHNSRMSHSFPSHNVKNHTKRGRYVQIPPIEHFFFPRRASEPGNHKEDLRRVSTILFIRNVDSGSLVAASHGLKSNGRVAVEIRGLLPSLRGTQRRVFRPVHFDFSTPMWEL